MDFLGVQLHYAINLTKKSVKLTVTASPTNISYTGEPVTTGITVMSGKMKLTEGTDYEIRYENNTDVGAATVIAIGIGNYEGSSGVGTFEITAPDTPKDIGASLFSGWTYQLCSWYSGLFSIMRFALENGELTVEHRDCRPHDNFSNAYASIEVYDTKGSRCYNKEYIGNKSNYAPTDTIELGLGYKVKIYVAEPGRGSTAVYSNAVPTVPMRPSQSAEYVVTARGLQQITSDGSIGAGDLASQYADVMYAYMDKLKEEHPKQADFWYNTKFSEEKAAVEKGAELLTADERTRFEADYEGYYPFKAPVDALAPTDITLISANYEVGQQAAALDGTTQAADGGTITYQWYQASAADDFEENAIDGAAEPTYTPDTSTAGTYYYFVKATNTNEDATGSKTASVTSSMATITVTAPVVKESYSVVYDWGSDYPSDAELPKDNESYDNLADAEAALSKQTYTNASASTADKNGKQGKWTFSGWTSSVEGTTVKFVGQWTFTADSVPIDAAAPEAIKLSSAKYNVGDAAAALNGTTTVSDDGTISYQWYRASSAADFAGTAIANATNAAYTPSTKEEGTYYYFVVATNTNAAVDGSKTASTTSNMAVITVTKPASNNSGNGSSGSSSGGGSSSLTPSYTVSVPKTANGSVTVPSTAVKGKTVTITVKPDTGYEVSGLSVTDQSGNHLALTDNGEGKYSFIMPDGKISVAVSFSKIQEEHTGFVDVSANAYYADAVQWAVAKGITEGTGKSTFSPNLSCTRAQMVTFLWRAAGSPAPKNNSKVRFADIDPSAYYYDAVQWAVEQGITNGTGDTAFQPNAAVTRGQTAAFLYRAAGSSAVDVKSGFADIQSDAYYADAVAWAEENSITSGVGNAQFDPNAKCTRAQIVAFLYRFQE